MVMLETVKKYLKSGWVEADETWAYASATTITVPSGAASKYQKGDKIKITNNSATKYFYIVSVADTVLTVTGGGDYTVHDSAITNPFYSKIENPQGFPQYFNFTPNWTNLTKGAGGTVTARFSIINGKVFLRVYFVFGSGSAIGGRVSFNNLPVASAITTVTVGALLDANVGWYKSDITISGSYCYIDTLLASGTYVVQTYFSSSVPMTWTTDDSFGFLATYEY